MVQGPKAGKSSPVDPSPAQQDDCPTVSPLESTFFAPGSAAWTDVLPKTDHVDIFRNTDFGSTALGPIAGWGPALRFYVTMLFANSRATALYWGPERHAIYNEPQAELVGELHPRLMGQAFADAFASISHAILPIFDQAAATAQTVDVNDIQLFPIRFGILEETYFIGQFIPLRGDSGEIEGFFNTVYESTFQVLYDRRRRVLDGIAAIPPATVNETFARFIEVLRSNPNDITMAMIYALDENEPAGCVNLSLRGSIGVPENSECAPRTGKLEKDTGGLFPYFRQAKESGAPVVLRDSDGSLQAVRELFADISWQGYGEASRDIVIVPLNAGKKLLGFYVQGTNPRRPYDAVFETSIVDLATQLVAKWVASMSTEEAVKREAQLQRRLTDSERRLRKMAQFAPMGMCSINDERSIEWANDQWYDIMGLERTATELVASLDPEHQEFGSRNIEALLGGKTRVVCEHKLTRMWSPPGNADNREADVPAWILAVCFPVFEDGKRLIMVYVMDISHQKWAESVQSRHAAAAELAKTQQEAFIDMTSHEMRNPLTAMIQLADSIAKSMDTGQAADASLDVYKAIIDQNVEAANTILTCTAHQKRIIDDVLILSRLESNMLSITPLPNQLTTVLANTVKMFDGEVAMSDVTIEIIKDASYDRLNVDYILCDSSRLMQVLINLINNAIKFTAERLKRKITVTYGATWQRPSCMQTDFGPLEWLRRRSESEGTVSPSAIKDGGVPLYVYFYVQDTGAGVAPAEMDKLFKRFSQASSKTHISYGGTGLGLYISRELVEKQGGEVGAASRYDDGSVFGFYIETRHVKEPGSAPLAHTSGDARPANDFAQTYLETTDESRQVPMRTREHPTLSQNGDVGNVHVLLVEDNLVNQKIFAKHLRRVGFDVSVANHGGEALDILEKSGQWRSARPDSTDDASNPIGVVLMDWEMPVMNGLQCCQRIRELEHEYQIPTRIPVVAITANVRQEQVNQVLVVMDDILLKPFTSDDLVRKIRETVGQVAKG